MQEITNLFYIRPVNQGQHYFTVGINVIHVAGMRFHSLDLLENKTRFVSIRYICELYSNTEDIEYYFDKMYLGIGLNTSLFM